MLDFIAQEKHFTLFTLLNLKKTFKIKQNAI